MNRKCILSVVFSLCLASAGLAAELPPLPPEGSIVEVREGDEWSNATLLRREGRRLQIRYQDSDVEEWVSSDRVRASSGKLPTPADRGSAAAAPAARNASDNSEPVTLEGPFIEITLENAPAPKRSSPLAAKKTPTTRSTSGFVRLGSGARSPVDKLLPCADGGNIVLGTSKKPFSDQTQIVRFDVDHPDQVEERGISAPSQQVVGAADGGRLLLTIPERDGVTIHLWEYSGEQYNLKANYTFVSKKGGRRVETAFLVSPSRALVCSDSDENYLVDLDTRRALCMFKTFGRKPELDPTGRLVLLFNNNNGGVLRASDCGVIAEFAGCESFQIPTLDPTGTLAAYPQAGGISIVKVANGASVATLTGVKLDRLSLIDAEHLLVGDVLYSIKTGVPLWRYQVPSGSIVQMLPSGQMLYVLRDSGAACVLTIPDGKALEALKAQRPEDYLLAPGAQIMISGGLELYGADQKAAEDIVRKAITTAGHKVAAGISGYTLAFTSAAGPTEEQSYMEHGYMGPPMSRKVSAPSTVVTATLKRDGQAIWQQVWKHGAGGMLMRKNNQSMEAAAAEAARPNAQSLRAMAVPAYIPKGSTLGETATLGASEVTPDGLAPVAPSEQQPKRNDQTPGAGDQNSV